MTKNAGIGIAVLGAAAAGVALLISRTRSKDDVPDDVVPDDVVFEPEPGQPVPQVPPQVNIQGPVRVQVGDSAQYIAETLSASHRGISDSVQWYLGTSRRAVGARWTTSWTKAGTYRVTAQVVDPDNQMPGSHTITVTVAGRRTPPPAPVAEVLPELTVLAPGNASIAVTPGQTVKFEAHAEDGRGNDISEAITWWHEATPGSFTRKKSGPAWSWRYVITGTYRAYARLDYAGQRLEVMRTVVVRQRDIVGPGDQPPGTPARRPVAPVVTISEPPGNVDVPAGTRVTLRAHAVDWEGRAIAERIEWWIRFPGGVEVRQFTGPATSLKPGGPGVWEMEARVMDHGLRGSASRVLTVK